ncbi:efflux RND transporter permease subunit [Penaeicola halotolerans]|uniref:efflux RND transporter permease subunit n=1 Tax=Penaeicola halotolerans TaxID=2793196 RepID=UPI001CF8185F|nr:MMPL family transporter [Penaeicola halotolerans]
MLNKLAHIILKYRTFLLVILLGITLFMAYKAQEVEFSNDFAKVVPPDDPEMLTFERFKATFGEDGNVMVLGVQDSALYTPENFRRFAYLSENIKLIKGVSEVISLPTLVRLAKDTSARAFVPETIFSTFPDDQTTLDSLLAVAASQQFYQGTLFNPENGATLILITLDPAQLNSNYKETLINDVYESGKLFEENTNIKVHYSGLPFFRVMLSNIVKSELKLFLIASAIITALFLLLFFRSKKAVIFPLALIGVMVIWVMGTLAILEYKITLLTGLLPTIMIIIGIPNCIYLLNKYHQEIAQHGNKMRAMVRVIKRTGLVTLITNVTTAIGFMVLMSSDISILKEFGVVAGVNILATFVVSIILIPIVFTWLPAPKGRELKHLEFKSLKRVLHGLDLLVHRHRYRLMYGALAFSLIGMWGASKLQAVSYMVDDIPEDNFVKQDLRFFEANFRGVMPLEILIDTGNKKGVTILQNLQLIDEVEQVLAQHEDVTKPLSVVSFVKSARQAYYNGNPRYYDLPNSRDRAFLLSYLGKNSDMSTAMAGFVDADGQKIRLTARVRDIGSLKMDSLINGEIKPAVNKVLEGSKLTADFTGTTLLFIKGNDFLIANLVQSLLLAFGIIAVIMAMLFANFRMILISLVPNLIPLILTAGIMGFFGIPLKPSTALIFSIAFGISVDDSIHFLAKYRQELRSNGFSVPLAISKSIKETGASMIYTSIVLFAGFVIFSGSNFGGTVALGILTSTTLFFAMITNLSVLPALLLRFDKGINKNEVKGLIEHFEFYRAEDDEEIDLELLEIKN